MLERYFAAAEHSAEFYRGGHSLLLQRPSQNTRHTQERPTHGARGHVRAEAEGVFDWSSKNLN